MKKKKLSLPGTSFLFGNYYKKITTLSLFLVVIPFVSVAQQVSNEHLLWKKESYGDMKMENEIVSLRAENAKHFKNDNGKMTAVLTAGPINYFENGSWKTIYHSIVQQNNGFENVTNRHKTYYPQTSTGAITTILENGAVMKDMIGMRMYYQSNGTELNRKSIQSQQGQVDFNELLYRNVYGNGIDLTVRQNTIGRKMDYIIREKSALGNIPSSADHLVFEEKVELPAGWKAVINGKKIDLKDGNGKLVAFYDQPRYTDTDTHAHHEHENADAPHEHHVNEMVGDYQISQQGNVLTIKTLVPVSWLKQDLNFPVFIDPTITLYPDNAARWTGHHRTNANNTTDCYASTCAAYTNTNIDENVQGTFWLGRYNTQHVYQGWVKFNITDIPDDACITSAVFRYNVQSNNSNTAGCVVQSRFRQMASDPSVNDFTVAANNQARLTDIRDGAIYSDVNTAVLVAGTGWRTVNLTANLTYLQTQLVPNWFAIGIQTFNGASNHLTCRNQIMGYSEANRPQLIVDYDPPTDVDNITICSGELPYNWHGQTITAGGNGVATRMTTGTNGCNMQVTLNLTVNPGTAPQTDNVTICQNQLPYNWHGQSITAGGNGVATRTTADANGCNYVTTLNLTVNPVTNTPENITICNSQLPYTWNGQTITAGGNGVATHTTTDANGCNVVTTLNLTVNSGTNTTDNITICQNQLPYSWNGQTITAGGNGVATHTTSGGNGCTSTVTLNLTVNPVTNTNDNITICQSDLPYSWNGQTVTAGGNGAAVHTTTDANGCNSTVTLNLTVIPTITTSDNVAICQSDLPYAWYGQTITAGGTGVATNITQDANGCDIIRTLNLTVNPEVSTTETIAICQNALPYTWRGQTVTAGGNGVAIHVAQDANGCDVTTTLNLTVNPVVQLTDNIAICSSQLPYSWNGQTITTGGNGVATHTIQDANGCDVITTLNLTVTQVPNVNFTVQAEPCIPAEIVITPTAVLTGVSYSWIMDGNVISTSNSGVNLTITTPGCSDMTLVVSTPNGCSSTVAQNPAFCVDEVPTADFSFTGSINTTTNPSVQMNNLSTNATSYNWVVSNGTSTSETSPLLSFNNSSSGVYSITLYAYSANGCVDSITKPIAVEEEIIFYVPNSFTPDHDEFNNSFGPVITSGIDLHNYTFVIYNRWGEMIFESHDTSIHWDGTYKGKLVQDGTYTWKIEFLELQTDARHLYTGHVSLIR